MHFLSSKIDIVNSLVLDTSVLINLHACKYGKQILLAIQHDIFIPKIVANELEHETSRKNGEYSFLQSLLADDVVSLVGLTDEEYQIFLELTSTAPSLDDGEAATIAIAVSRKVRPVIDERRGRARASRFMKILMPYWSLDLFRHPDVVAMLGNQTYIDAIYYALFHGRMRIPPESADDVIALIGMKRSRNCTCLPGYRERFGDIRIDSP